MNKRILIADDEPNIRLVLRTALESVGHEVIEAANGREALAAIDTQTPDLMVLDLSMPVMDGMAVLEALRERPAKTKPRVIVLTAYGSVPAAVKAVRLGARDFIEKPVTPDDLRLSVTAVLEEPAGDEPDPELGYGEVLQQVRSDLLHGDFNHAEAMLMRAAELAGTDPVYFNLLGVLHEAGGRRALARKFYGKAIRENRNYEPAQQNMRRLYELTTFGHTKHEVVLGDEADVRSGIDGGSTGRGAVDRLRRLLDRNPAKDGKP
ncbi:hypothetical protein BH09GEM1_BH09GEM1_48100 [soil metagenome]